MSDEQAKSKREWKTFLSHIKERQPTLYERFNAAQVRKFSPAGAHLVFPVKHQDAMDAVARDTDAGEALWVWFGCPVQLTVSLEQAVI